MLLKNMVEQKCNFSEREGTADDASSGIQNWNPPRAYALARRFPLLGRAALPCHPLSIALVAKQHTTFLSGRSLVSPLLLYLLRHGRWDGSVPWRLRAPPSIHGKQSLPTARSIAVLPTDRHHLGVWCCHRFNLSPPRQRLGS